MLSSTNELFSAETAPSLAPDLLIKATPHTAEEFLLKIKTLCISAAEVITAFLDEGGSKKNAVIYIDVGRGGFKWPGESALTYLPPDLASRLFFQMLRTTSSPVRYQLLPRCRPPVRAAPKPPRRGPKSLDRPARKAFRKTITDLKRMLHMLRLPIRVDGTGDCVWLAFDPLQVERACVFSHRRQAPFRRSRHRGLQRKVPNTGDRSSLFRDRRSATSSGS
jgi:hypothetical protein